MIRLWRYWPVRVIGGWVFLVPVVGFGMLCGFGIGSGKLALGVAALVAAGLCGVACNAMFKWIDRAAGLAPLRERMRNNQFRAIGLMILPVPLFVTGPIALSILFPDPQSLSYLALIFFVLLAIVPPFLFAANAWPRNRLQWTALAFCIPAMHAASLFAPFVAGVLWRSLFDGAPGIAAMLGTMAIAYIAFNAPFALLLVKSGACPWKVEPAEIEEEAQA